MGSTTDRIKGVANEAVGNARQAIGRAVGNTEMQVKGKLQEVKGETQQAKADAKDAVKKVRVIASTTLQKLFKDIGPRHVAKGEKKERKGGYTRIIKLARRRIGDNASQCLLELVESRSAEGKTYTQVSE